MIRLLIIEDNPEIGAWLTKELKERGYEVIWLKSAETMNKYINQVDLILLDIMLPGLDGFSISKRIKRSHPDLPILILSARSAVEDKIEGLRFADDYVTKPFHPDELEARIHALLRRYQKDQENFSLKHLLVDPKGKRILNRETGEEILLTGKQYHLFWYLIQHANQILTKEQLYEGVWNQPYLEGDKTLMVHIRYLREKVEKDPSHPTIIETIRGIGYRVRR